MRRKTAGFAVLIGAAAALALAVAPGEARGAFEVVITAGDNAPVTLTPVGDLNFILIDGTYGDYVISDFRGADVVRFNQTDSLAELFLTNTLIRKTTNSNQSLVIRFFQTFNRPNNGVTAGVGLDGTFATGPGNGNLSNSTSAAFSGFLESNQIDKTLTSDVAGKPSGSGVNLSGMDQRFLLGNFTLEGRLVVQLGFNERLALPDSAVVRVAAVPEPGGFALFGLGAACLAAWGRRRGRARPRAGHDALTP
jgi:hypothetical protein